MASCLRVLTLNTWNQDGPYVQRRALIRASLRSLAPDIAGFQEIGLSQVSELLADLGYTHVWHGHGDSGMAIASRWPITQSDAVDLPAASDDGVGGIVQRSLVQAPFGSVPFVNTTTYYPKPHEGWKRERQMPVLADAVRRWQGHGMFPALLVGDFNCDADSTEIRFLKGLQSIDGKSTYFADAWERAGDGGPGATWTRRNPYSAVWGLPDRRIDFVFVGAPGVQGAGAVRLCRVVCDESVDGVWPSDHLGVLAELQIGDFRLAQR